MKMHFLYDLLMIVVFGRRVCCLCGNVFGRRRPLRCTRLSHLVERLTHIDPDYVCLSCWRDHYDRAA